MKRIIITSIFILGLSFTSQIQAQQRPARPAEKELINAKRQELAKKYEFDKKMIKKHPILTDKMKKAQLKTLKEKYNTELKVLNKSK